MTGPAPAPLLEVRGLTKSFGGLVAVREVDLTLRQDEILGLIGPNGAGKTTLFNLLSGNLRRDSGSVRLRGREIAGAPAHRTCRLGLARTFQVPRPFLSLTVFDSVLVGASFGRRGGRETPVARAERCLGLAGLLPRRDDRVAALNLAERKRLDLARALATRPHALLVDEVAAGLNPSEVKETVDILRQIHERGVGIIYVEHVMDAVMGVSDRIHVLDHGTTIAVGSPAEVTRNPAVIEAYLGGSEGGEGGS